MKEKLFIFILISFPTLIIGQNHIKSPEERKLLKKAKVSNERAYITDKLKTFKKLAHYIEYDTSGNIIRFESNYLNQRATSKQFFEYDSQNKLIKKTVCQDSLCNNHTVEEYNEKGNVVKSFSYDQSGNLISSVVTIFNINDKKTEETVTYPPQSFSKSIYNYNEKDSLIQIVTKNKDGKITYDSKNEKSDFGFGAPILFKEMVYISNPNVINIYNEQSLVTSREINEDGYLTIIVFEYAFFK